MVPPAVDLWRRGYGGDEGQGVDAGVAVAAAGPVRLHGRGGEAALAPLPPDPAIPRLQLLPSMRIRPELAGAGGGGGQGWHDFMAPYFHCAGCGRASVKAMSDLPARRR